jgi:hypothetical protein
MTAPGQYASVGYLAGDGQAAIGLYATHLGFTPNSSAAPAFADVARGPLRLLPSGPASSAARATPAGAATVGRNRIHLAAAGPDAAITRLRDAGPAVCGDTVAGPGEPPILPADPVGHPLELSHELSQPARRPASPAEAS